VAESHVGGRERMVTSLTTCATPTPTATPPEQRRCARRTDQRLHRTSTRPDDHSRVPTKACWYRRYHQPQRCAQLKHAHRALQPTAGAVLRVSTQGESLPGRVACMNTSYAHLRTERLYLDAVTAADLDPMFQLHSDPEVWRHLPSGQHLDRERTRTFISNIQESWGGTGLGYWVARLAQQGPSRAGALGSGDFVGVGGCARRLGIVWNIYYRLAPAAWGCGYASEIVVAARSAAIDVDPDMPVVAYLLEHNVASKRTAERAGLTLAWSGPDHGNADRDAVRLIYSDRPLPDDVTTKLVSHT
jgi:RimJ/RimL family protein N-acetyltransferase